ncbi:hypothetical protein DM860_001869 [Cuscuta australis]|uniref:Nucleobase-ascorbate transporter 10 n=1 Tax=Cuscuta australis TaxID=267555 RepID=A0A328EE61_9ASTE|nr:hypothetical protein DM860_001869 [Cuscuta australis]
MSSEDGGNGNGGGGGGNNGGGGGGGGNNNNNKKAEEAKKAEEKPQPHAVLEQLSGVQYCINSPPSWSEALCLGFQHYLLTLGNIVFIPKTIVPQMGGGKVEEARVMQTLLFISGLNTLFQSLFGVRLPSIIGGSYAYLIPITSIIQTRRLQHIVDPHMRFEHSMRAIQGALIVASCFQVITGFIGLWRNATRFLSPLSVVPLITLTGLGLFHLGFPLMAKCAVVGVPELFLIVLASQYLPTWLKLKRPILDRFGVLFCVSIVWTYAAILTYSGPYKTYSQENCRVDGSGLMSGSSWIQIPLPFQWGPPTFNAGDVFAMLSSCFVSSIESTAVFYATSRYGSATPVPPSIVSRSVGWLVRLNYKNLLYVTYSTPYYIVQVAIFKVALKTEHARVTLNLTLHYSSSSQTYTNNYYVNPSYSVCILLLQGVGTMLSGIFGGLIGPCATPENAGLLALTKVGSRRVAQISAGFMIFFSILGKFGAFFASIPMAVMAALYCVFFAYVSSAGLGFLQFCNLNSFRTKFILGFSLFMGLSLPQYFKEHQMVSGSYPVHTHAKWFNDIICVVFTSHATVAVVLAEFLDRTLPNNDSKDNGLHWWQKFVAYGRDVRSDEFYKLPFKLNRFFPSY